MSVGRGAALAAGAVSVGALLYYYLARSGAPPPPPQKKKKESSGDTGKKEVAVLFGSQTGTAEEFAEELTREFQRRCGSAETLDLETFDEDDVLDRKLVVFVLATYGEGDPTDNAVDFDTWLKDAQDSCFDGVDYAIMGLGNTQYVHFNGMSRRIDEALERCGARRICDTGEGDDGEDIEADFSKWKSEKLWPAVEAMGLGSAVEEKVTRESVLERLPLLADVRETAGDLCHDASVMGQGTDVVSKGYFVPPVRVEKIQELRQVSDKDRSTVQVDLDATGLSYETADTADILPENPPAFVEHVAAVLGANLNHHLTWQKNPENDTMVAKRVFPTPCTVQEALAKYCDLSSMPSRSAATNFAAFASAADQENVAKFLESPLFKEAGADGVHLGFLEFWQLFLPSLDIELTAFLQICPRLKPRSFTIASSCKDRPDVISVAVGLVQKDLPPLGPFLAKLSAARISCSRRALGKLPAVGSDRRFQGIASRFLCLGTESARTTVPLAVHKSSFRLPTKSCPLIMIGAGTGVAPFRGFLRELLVTGWKDKTMLFFGCQRRDVDFIYRDEFEEAQQEGVLTHLVTAFSREQKHKVYVQHKVAEEAELVKEFFDAGAVVYICGATAMGNDVLTELAKIVGDLQPHRGTRIIEELWG